MVLMVSCVCGITIMIRTLSPAVVVLFCGKPDATLPGSHCAAPEYEPAAEWIRKPDLIRVFLLNNCSLQSINFILIKHRPGREFRFWKPIYLLISISRILLCKCIPGYRKGSHNINNFGVDNFKVQYGCHTPVFNIADGIGSSEKITQ